MTASPSLYVSKKRFPSNTSYRDMEEEQQRCSRNPSLVSALKVSLTTLSKTDSTEDQQLQ